MRRLFLVFSCLALLGCSIHPIPDDLKRGSTADIVKKIRCEARMAIDLYAPPSKYDTAAIAYQFDFITTENNKASGGATFTMPFTNGKFTLALGAGEDKQRVGDRAFLMVESFKELRKEDCSIQATRENWRYPITGIVGMEEIISTFVKLTELGFLENATDKVASFVDTLDFTTTIRGNVDPTIELNPVTDSFRLTKATASFSADRTDRHKLILSLSVPVPATRMSRSVTGGSPSGDAKNRALLGLERQDVRSTNRRIQDLLRTTPIQ
jgi:hypothetical protein